MKKVLACELGLGQFLVSFLLIELSDLFEEVVERGKQVFLADLSGDLESRT